jgi:osmoprotectant transport system permease protein
MSFLRQALDWFVAGAHWQGSNGIPHRLGEHLLMSAVSVVAAAALALPIGILLGHRGRGGFLAINVSNVGRAVPSFGLLVIAFQLFGIGAKPAFVALFALAIPPIVTNSYVGVSGVDADVREAARGMGMRERAVLLKVEVPLAMPLIMAGLRTSAVQVVATATLAALVAWGGLGRYIVDGLAQQDYVQEFCGAAMVAVLSIIVELGLGGLQRLAIPKGLRIRETTADDPVYDPATSLKAA